MSPHRRLDLDTFVAAIPPDQLERYFENFDWEKRPEGWPILNGSALGEFLDRPENAQFRGVVMEEFRRINDLCARNMNLLVTAYKRSSVDMQKDATAQTLAMRLYLDDADAFEYAWSRFLLFGGSPKLSIYPLPVLHLDITNARIARFEARLNQWFSDYAKGHCLVKVFDDKDESIIRISRGSYMRTVACWEGDQIGFTTFRPASEDVLAYNREASQLTIKASLAKDRDEYMRSFAVCIADDEALAATIGKGQVFSLVPIQDGSFNFGGDGIIDGIELVKVRLKLAGPDEPEIEIRSKHVPDTVATYLRGLSLASGQLTYARFRLVVRPLHGRPAAISFEIEPPARTDLAQKRYADIIESYLREQKVKLA
ncbi:MAG TPA: hypothetical protein VJM51_05820 [Dehalococcoidia bacterium]|nr:hypothetical protein [Dehalococcoidia bacterium]HLC30279.1 hypothetical protein [Dehalococcoidia bacterium]